MKKSIIFSLFSAVFAMSASAEYYTVPAAGEVFTSELSSSITSTGGMTGGQMTFQFSSSKTVATITSDFVFENHVYLENTTTDTTSTNQNMYHANFTINNGAELTFNQITLDAPIKTRFGLYSSSGARGSVIMNSPLSITGGVSKGLAEYWLQNVKLTFTSGSAYMGYSHFVYAPEVVAKDCTLTLSNIALRNTKTIDGRVMSGTVSVNNGTVIVSALTNQNKVTSNFDFVFETQNAETFDFNAKLSTFTDVAANPVSVEFKGMDFNDKIYSVEDLETLSNFKVNGATISSLIEDGAIKVETIMKDGAVADYIYTYAIPEPAEWAAIFGAIALGFVAYRRRK